MSSIAKLLLELKAVALNTEKPFRYTSGLLSPIYCDNRLIISDPEKRTIIIDAFLKLIDKDCDVIAGVATAGIPHAAWIADRLNKPMVYVRAKAKEHGKQNQIEGRLPKNSRVVVIEDLISTGQSSIAAGQALREAGATVNTCLAIFTYDFAASKRAFADAEIELKTLCNFNELIEIAVKEKYITAAQKEILAAWNKDPQNWQKESQG